MASAWQKFREEIRQEMTISRLREREVDNRLTISEGEIDNYLENASRPGGNEELVQVAHIIVRVPEQADAPQLARSPRSHRAGHPAAAEGRGFRSRCRQLLRRPGRSGRRRHGAAAGRPPAGPLCRCGAEAEAGRDSAASCAVRPVSTSSSCSKGAVAPCRLQPLKQTHARHILIRVNELVSETEAKRRLDGLKERLDNGGDFAELARLHSNDLSAAKGGDLGWLYQGDTVPEFERAMDALKIGEISQPVRSPFGWHLIQVQERRTEDASADRKRLLARQALRARKSDEAYQDWLRQMRDRAYVEYRLEEK